MKKSIYILSIVVLVTCSIISCESSFEPLQKNDEYDFSIYGALDIHADTQWVRVMPIGEKLLPDRPDTNDVEVTITRLKTGEKVKLNDSLFVFSNGMHVWNYWTTIQLNSNEKYRLEAVSQSGKKSSATTITPSPLPIPTVKYSERNDHATIKGFSEDPIVRLDTKFLVQERTLVGWGSEFEVIISHLDEVYRRDNGSFSLRFFVGSEITKKTGVKRFRVNEKYFYIATGNTDWPDVTELSDLEAALPDVVSNVQDGTGVLAAIAQRKLPLKSCYDADGNLIPCQEL